MRSSRFTAASLAVALAALAACAGPSTPEEPVAPSQDLPPIEQVLDGELVEYSLSNEAVFSYGTVDGYSNRASDPTTQANTLDALLPQPRQQEPIVVKIADLNPAQLEMTLDQRAISQVVTTIEAGGLINVIPSKVTALYKASGTTPADSTIDPTSKRLRNATFSAVYLEDDGINTAAVLLTAHATSGADRQSYLTGEFYEDRGLTGYDQQYRSQLPGEAQLTRIIWTASILQQDCTVRSYGWSAHCLMAAPQDNVPYAGYDNVILVTPVHVLELRHYYWGGDRVYSANRLDFLAPVSRDGTRRVKIMRETSTPHGAPEFDKPATEVFSTALIGGGQLIDGNTVSRWPAFSVLN